MCSGSRAEILNEDRVQARKITLGAMLNPDLVDFLTYFQPGTHAVLFYDTPEAKRELLFHHLKYGEDRQALAYVCAEESSEQIREEMNHFGLDVHSVKGKKQITIANYDEVYIVNGRVSIPEIIGKFSSMVDASRTRGLSGLRAGAEMSCFFKHDMIPEMVAYEKALHTRFPFSAAGICAYNVIELVKSGHMNIFMTLVKAHDPIIYSTPSGFLLLKPPRAQESDIETVMQVKVSR